MQGQRVSDEQFELGGEDLMQDGHVVEEAEEESEAKSKEQGEESVKQEQAGPVPVIVDVVVPLSIVLRGTPRR